MSIMLRQQRITKSCSRSLFMRKTGTVLALMVSTVVCFANINDDITTMQKTGRVQAGLVSHGRIETLKVLSEQNQSEQKSLIDTFMADAKSSFPDKQRAQAADGAMLFVSFSMPEPLLFALADEAATYHIPLVVNGLVDGDFKKTIDTFARLTANAKKQSLTFQGISIDPVWFQQFHIESVPALVVTIRPETCDEQTVCINQSFDVVYGNAHVKKGLELIAERGDAAPKVAKNILEQGHV